LHLVVGIGEKKDVDAMLQILNEFPDAGLYLTQTTFKPRLLADYGPWLDKAVHIDADPLKMLDHVRTQAQDGDMILVTGSLYLVGTIRGSLLRPADR
jgi:folylpolyglutamate synthase/dihydropteroate synthase